MTFRHPKIFVTVYETESMTVATSQLFIAQPPISLTISEMEDYYEVRLFDRISRKLYLTENGRRALQYARHIIDLLDEMEQGVRDVDAMRQLRVDINITIGTYLLPGCIKKPKQQYPALKVEASIASSGTIEQQILDSDVDVGIIEGAAHSPFILNESSVGDRLVSTRPAGHELTRETLEELSEVRNQGFILRKKGSVGREIFNGILAAWELNVCPTWRSTGNQIILQGVKAGLGISILPYFLVRQDIREGKLAEFRIKDLALDRKYSVIYHKNKFLSRSARTLMELCKEGNGADRP